LCLAALEMLVIAWSSHRTWEGVGGGFQGVGNLLHLLSYGVLAALLWLGLVGYAREGGRVLPGLLAVLFGLGDEIHQHFVGGRSCSVVDLLVDACGAAAFLLLVSRLGRRSLSFSEFMLVGSILLLGTSLAVWGTSVLPAFDGLLEGLLVDLTHKD